MNILKQDYITNLPMNIKEEVLMKLPIKEAARTSLLSTKWKYAWMSVPNLVFIEDYAESTLIRMVDEVLLVHRGPILQFKLVSRHACNEAIDRWMLILSKNGINNLHIQIQYSIDHPVENYMIPSSSSFFSCLALEHVHIFLSTIHVPPSFLGFKFLRTLRLLQFNLTGIDVSKLISSCPLLESLELSGFVEYGRFVIHAPNLIWLSITGEFGDLCLETPKLIFVDINLEGHLGCYMNFTLPSNDCKSNILRVLGSLSAIEEIQLCSNFLSFFAKGPQPEALPVRFYQLTELHIDFYDVYTRVVATAFSLFKSSPNLKVLSLKLPEMEEYLESSSLDQSFWEVEGIESNMFSCLQIVKITYSVGCPKPILKFAKFLLRTAPVLEKLAVREIRGRRETRSFLKKLARFARLSKIAEIVFVD